MLKPFYNDALIEAGLDEVGRGCLAGPVVAAAVILPKDFEHELLNDSKQLSKYQRNILRQEIIDAALDWAIAEVSNQEIDQINILKASFLAMHRAIDQLTYRPEHLLVDGNRFTPYPFIPHTCIVKGDALFMSIAAASILAKTYRDDLMEQLSLEYPHYQWAQNVGYPTPAHRRAIQEHGSCCHHRLSFKLI
ncbi:ribonuclease HII [Runella sp. MFBS21]|uniref:ribonuclease HII n=1 Tax=Runella sp. MFBS21 TaxID=3034018 RepID=UPI0023F84B3B|nr:ribonuclease HII [Runella sp. MFBS21]MDF7819023.1 ribonuclease HII [Runella sp. MFBS21]